MLRRPLQLLTLTLASLAVLSAPSSEAAVVVIDDFNVDLGPTTTSLSDGAGFFGSRTIASSSTDGTIQVALGNLTFTNGAGTSDLQGGVFWPLFPLITGLDLIDGTNDLFRLEVGPVVGTWTAKIGVVDQNLDSAFSSEVPLVSGQDSFFPFLGFSGITFSQVTEVSLILRSLSNPGDSVTIHQLVAVPEPGAAALLALGLLGLAVGSTRKRTV